MNKTTRGKGKLFLSMLEIEKEFFPKSLRERLEGEEVREQYGPDATSLSNLLHRMREQIRKQERAR
jgi:hypothetical protein